MNWQKEILYREMYSLRNKGTKYMASKKKLSRELEGLSLAELAKWYRGNSEVSDAIKQLRGTIDKPGEQKISEANLTYVRKRVLKDGSLRWTSVVYFGLDETGKKITRSISGKTQKESQLKAQELIDRKDQMETPKTYWQEMSDKKQAIIQEPTLSEFLTEWLDARTNISRLTRLSYQKKINPYIANPRDSLPNIGDIKVGSVTTRDVAKLEKAMTDIGLAQQTIRTLHIILKSAYKWGMINGIVSTNPLLVMDSPKVDKQEMRALDVDELKRLRVSAKGSRLEDFVAVAIATGMRRSELKALTWKDINFDTGNKTASISVNSALTYVNGYGNDDHQTKTKSSNRLIVFERNHPVIKKLQARLDRLTQHRQSVDYRINPRKDYIFAYEDGSPWGNQLIYNEWRSIVSTASLEGLRIHDLRHTHATLALGSGEPIDSVKRRLGHSSIKTTSDIYGHATPSSELYWVKRFAKVANLDDESDESPIKRVS